jgi:hypothetical protein
MGTQMAATSQLTLQSEHYYPTRALTLGQDVAREQDEQQEHQPGQGVRHDQGTPQRADQPAPGAASHTACAS